MRRGDIYFADLNPVVGSEITKQRPVLIVSNNANNRAASTVTVVPLTSQVSRVYPFEVMLTVDETGLSEPSKAQVQQIRTISKQRVLGRQVGRLGVSPMQNIEAALKLHLDLR